MAKKKKGVVSDGESDTSIKADAANASPPVMYGSEVHCSRCGGMVNFNGCPDADCPVRKK